MKKLLILVVLLILALPVTLAVMQDNASPTLDITGVNPNDLPTVIVTTNILDHLGQPASGLAVNDFSISGDLADDVSIINVENITVDNLSFASVLVIDTSSSMAGLPLQQVQDAAKQFVSALREDDPVAIITFNTGAIQVLDYTTDKDLLISTIDSLSFGGKTALYDASLLGVQKALESPLPRRAVVLLSDGGEFGGVSTTSREAALEEARIRGVPIYTIGLGWHIDQRYLEVLSENTNATFYESPTPDDLNSIYNGLAQLFRSQYIVTLDAQLPPDGTEYTLVMQATTSQGVSNEATATLRAPILIPIISIDDTLLADEISEPVTIVADIAADDAVETVSFVVDEVEVSDTNTYTIDPIAFAPGGHTLGLNVTDSSGDTGTFTADFTVAALPSEVTISGLLGDIALDTPQTITLEAEGQTPATRVTYSVDDLGLLTTEEAPFAFELNPFLLSVGTHTLGVDVVNEGGAVTTVTQDFSVAALPPQVSVSGVEASLTINEPVIVSVEGITQTGATITDLSADVDGNVLEVTDLSFTIDPFLFQPGDKTLTVNIADSNGQATSSTVDFVVAALAPEFTLDLAEDELLVADTTVVVDIASQTVVTGVSYSYDGGDANSADIGDLGASIPVDANTLGDGTHTLAVTVTNGGGMSATEEVSFEVKLPPTATPTPEPTDTSEPSATPTNTEEVAASATPVPPTDVELPTETEVPPTATSVLPTETSVPPTDTEVPPTDTEEPADTEAPTEDTASIAEATSNAQATDEAGTTDAQATQDATDAQPTDADATTNAGATDVPTDEPTEAASDEATDQPTEESDEPTVVASLTPVEIEDVGAPGDAPDVSQPSGITIFIVVLVITLLLIILYAYLRSRGQS